MKRKKFNPLPVLFLLVTCYSLFKWVTPATVGTGVGPGLMLLTGIIWYIWENKVNGRLL